MPLNFVKKKLIGGGEASQGTARNCIIRANGSSIILECDNGTRFEISNSNPGAGCVQYVDPVTGEVKIECDRDIRKALARAKLI